MLCSKLQQRSLILGFEQHLLFKSDIKHSVQNRGVNETRIYIQMYTYRQIYLKVRIIYALYVVLPVHFSNLSSRNGLVY